MEEEKSVGLIFNSESEEDEKIVHKEILALLKNENVEVRSLRDLKELQNFEKQKVYLIYLKDEDLKNNFHLFIKKEVTFFVLPHPKGEVVNSGLGVGTSIKKAIEHFQNQKESVALDLLFCNGRPVFGHIAVGDTFQLVSKKVPLGHGPYRRIKAFFKRVFRISPFPLEITLSEEKVIKTVAAGAIIAQHRQSSILSRLIPGQSFIQEGMLHAFVLSPRSIGELLKFTVMSFFNEKYFPEFGAHIKREKLKLMCPLEGVLSFTEDGQQYLEQSLDLEVKKNIIKVVPVTLNPKLSPLAK